MLKNFLVREKYILMGERFETPLEVINYSSLFTNQDWYACIAKLPLKLSIPNSISYEALKSELQRALW